jgi:hypothetical protein
MAISANSTKLVLIVFLAASLSTCGKKSGFSSNNAKTPVAPKSEKAANPDVPTDTVNTVQTIDQVQEEKAIPSLPAVLPSVSEPAPMVITQVEEGVPAVIKENPPLVKDFTPSANVVKGGEKTQIELALQNIVNPTVKYQIEIPAGAASSDNFGEVSATGLYSAPDKLPQNLSQVNVLVTLNDDPMLSKKVSISVIPKVGFVAIDDGKSEGAVGVLYDLASIRSELSKIPDWSKLAPVAKVVMANFAVPKTNFSLGFPGVNESLKEYFGISFSGKIILPKSGKYKFTLSSDDGANFYIDNNKIVDNDGTHSYSSKSSEVELTAGEHSYKLDYYQGPATSIGLSLFWVLPGETEEKLVPAGVFRRE